MSINKGMNEKTVVHSYNRIIFRKKENFFAIKWINLKKKKKLSERSLTQKSRYCIILLM